jgi:hypothetical protein
MFKKLLAFLLLVFVFFSVKAQSIEYDNKIHLGFKFGINMTGFTNDIGPLDKNSPDYAKSPFVGSQKDAFLTAQIGITADYRINNSLSIASELLCNGRGGSYKIRNNNVVLTDTAGNQTTAYDEFIYELYYFEVPLLIRYHLPVPSIHTAYIVYSGVSPGIKIVSHTIYNYYTLADNGVDVNTNSQTTPVNNLRSFEMSPVVGFWIGGKGIDHSWSVFADTRFEYTYSPVFNTSNLDTSNFQTAMWTVSFGFGVRF